MSPDDIQNNEAYRRLHDKLLEAGTFRWSGEIILEIERLILAERDRAEKALFELSDKSFETEMKLRKRIAELLDMLALKGGS